MDYKETLEYLYNSMPMFQQIGSKAYKEGLANTYALDNYFDHPHRKYRTIHVAGTNGKGSCSHTLAAILQEAGYKTGLYTSPHLIDFRERIRINGKCIPEDYIIRFVGKYRSFFEPLYPSFFELTTAMAFLYFAEENVDIAVIEVGLGGRLDCTNVIIPDLSIITNISFDHVRQLGDSLTKIAVEKAGIIKPGIPVIIGESTPETKTVFTRYARENNAPVIFAENENELIGIDEDNNGNRVYQTKDFGTIHSELGGLCQIKNTKTILSAVKRLIQTGYHIAVNDIAEGFAHVTGLTGLMGRWQKLRDHPAIICDTGHNIAGISDIVEQLNSQSYHTLRIIFGIAGDKDVNGILSLLPTDAAYYFTQAGVKRALPADKLKFRASACHLRGNDYPDVISAVKAAQEESLPEDLIFVGGSSFIVADLLSGRDALDLH